MSGGWEATGNLTVMYADWVTPHAPSSSPRNFPHDSLAAADEPYFG